MMNRLAAALLTMAMQIAATSCLANENGRYVQSARPTTKDALRLAFRNANIPLPDNPSCNGVDTTGLIMPTLGDWLAGILAEFPPVEGVSGVEAACQGDIDALRCSIHVRRRSGNEVWKWGVRFAANGVQGTIAPDSVQCDSAG